VEELKNAIVKVAFDKMEEFMRFLPGEGVLGEI